MRNSSLFHRISRLGNLQNQFRIHSSFHSSFHFEIHFRKSTFSSNFDYLISTLNPSASVAVCRATWTVWHGCDQRMAWVGINNRKHMPAPHLCRCSPDSGLARTISCLGPDVASLCLTSLVLTSRSPEPDPWALLWDHAADVED